MRGFLSHLIAKLKRKANPHLFGKRGEELALSFLRKKGYRIVERGYRTRFGEIDIIAYDGEVLCFIEVKVRRSDKKGLPEEAIPSWKRERIRRMAEGYLGSKGFSDIPCRFDVVAIYSPERGRVEINLIKDAF